MKEIIFDPAKGTVSASVTLTGVMDAEYNLYLYETDGFTEVMKKAGNNESSGDDVHDLPPPESKHHQRTLRITSKFAGKDIVNFPDYSIGLEVLQDGQSLGSDSRSGKLDGTIQKEKFSLKLIACKP